MCKSVAEGGQRCAAHTRPKFEAATPGTPEWDKAAEEYASTPEGHTRLSEEAEVAELIGNEDEAAALRAALKRGDTIREANAEAARVIDTAQKKIDLQEDLDAWATKFNVGEEQVRRDHLISHILGALTTMDGADDLIFFGGTALSRTHLPNLRLSEDIDLITKANRRVTAEAIQDAIGRGLQRTHGVVDWTPALTATSGSEAATLVTPDGTRVQVQLLSSDGYENWPTEKVPLIQRYQDAPPASLTTFTPTAFAAVKTATWADRAAPRDLYDTWALGEHGYVTPEAAALYRRYGPTGNNPAAHLFKNAPTDDAWTDALEHQADIQIGPHEALEAVRTFWTKATQT